MFKQIWQKISSAKYITLCTHIEADGDTIGSAIALRELINDHFDDKVVKISGEKYPRNLQFLGHPDEVSDDFFNQSLVIVVDTSTISRIFDKRVQTDQTLKIDHHPPENQWLLALSDPQAPATGQIIFQLAKALNLTLSPLATQAIFIAIWTDTEGMSHRNLTDETQNIISNLQVDQQELIAQLKPQEQEQLFIDQILSLAKHNKKLSYIVTDQDIPNDLWRIIVSQFLKKQQGQVLFFGAKCNGVFRCGLRSDDATDVSQIAKLFGGGGHKTSAGFKVNTYDQLQQGFKIVEQKLNFSKSSL